MTTALMSLIVATRVAVVASAEDATGQARLRYAERDGDQVAEVLRELGAVAGDDLIRLHNATADELRAAIDRAEEKVKRASGSVLMLYYSGHADSHGLLLGTDRLPYDELRDRVERSSASVRVAVLDSCDSGQIVRRKGGSRGAEYSIDVVRPERVTGAAIISASAAFEPAQESSELSGSYFTHHLVSALRGAADYDANGRITLGEAYQYAYGRTIADTSTTLLGPQHPAYDYRLAGNGDLILTEPGRARGRLLLPREDDALYLVADSRGAMVAEAQSTSRHQVAIAVTPGRYRLTRRRHGRVAVAEASVQVDSSRPIIDLSWREVSGAAGGQAKGAAHPQHAVFFDYALVGMFFAGLTPVSEFGLSARRVLGRWHLEPRLAYSAAQLEGGDYFYRLRRIGLELRWLRRLDFQAVRFDTGLSLGMAHVRQDTFLGPSLSATIVTARLCVGTDIPLWNALYARLVSDAGGNVMPIDGRLRFKPELRVALALGFLF